MSIGSQRENVAEALAHALLGDMPDRWRHTQAVAGRARGLATTVAVSDREVLVIAAWLHDIGYSPALHDTGFHPLDAARYLAGHGWPPRVCALVAHHSCAAHIAAVRALSAELAVFDRECSPAADALTYADQTTGPHGQLMHVDDRIADMLVRHGPGSPQARAAATRTPEILAMADRVGNRLRHQPTGDSTSITRP